MVVTRLLLLVLLAGAAAGAEIRLIYPRLATPDGKFTYDRRLDSTFVFGHVMGYQPGMSLTCMGQPLNLTTDGAFLAFVPIPWEAETLGWSFALTNVGAGISGLFFPYEPAPEATDPVWQELDGVVGFVVNDPTSHTRTVPGGSYHLFPSVGTELAVNAVTEKWARFELGEGRTGAIERRFVDSTGVIAPGYATLGNGQVGPVSTTKLRSTVGVEFAVSGRTLNEVQTSPDGREVLITLFQTRAAIDRIRYIGAAREFIEDITWSQGAETLTLRVLVRHRSLVGYRVEASDSTWTLNLDFSSDNADRLRGKTIVLDPGHGGTADGAIGPRGSKEKDVVLRWSEVLTDVLRANGAVVYRTREADVAMDLHERANFARLHNTDAFLSLHANALPDGENPFERRGCGTYYYQSLSRGLAETVHEAILSRTGLADDGVFDANFAVVRPTDFPAVLIEAAYIMHPDEELLLSDDQFLRQLSRGVTDGLVKFFSKVPAR